MDKLRIERRAFAGKLAKEVSVEFSECSSMPPSDRIEDVASLLPGRTGRAVRLAPFLERIGTKGARYLNVVSQDPAFAVSIPLTEAEGALVLYGLGEEPLPEDQGGPFRLLVPGHPDECVHVKQVALLELSDRPGRDTRPKDDTEHAKIHKK
jgi:hypothetical protein